MEMFHVTQILHANVTYTYVSPAQRSIVATLLMSSLPVNTVYGPSKVSLY